LLWPITTRGGGLLLGSYEATGARFLSAKAGEKRMKLWIQIEVEASEIDWSESNISYTPCSQHIPGGWDGDVIGNYYGQEIVDMDYDKAWDYLIEGKYENQ